MTNKYFSTARRMDEAFLSLMERKDFEYITVTEICSAAGVNRSTFYLHYETIGDLLEECIQTQNAQFAECFSQTYSDFKESIEAADLEQLFLITPEYLIPYLTFIADNKTVFKVVLKHPRVMQSDKRFALFEDIFNRILERYHVPESRREYMLYFYIEGMMGIIKRWLMSDCSDSVSEVADIIMSVIRR